ncbi:MAG: MobA/MobL family protein [Synergistaceae bacterium]|nr:MobA/MobL family protein [Synergistaceae bacterium]
MCADVCIHDKGARNPHAHMPLHCRRLAPSRRISGSRCGEPRQTRRFARLRRQCKGLPNEQPEAYCWYAEGDERGKRASVSL